MGHLGVVVGESDGGERTSRKHGNPYEAIAQVRPKQCRDDDCDDNQQPAHGGRTGFLLVSLGALFANELSDLELAQATDDERSYDESGEQGGKTSECRAEGDIAKDAERRNIVLQLDEQQPVEQSASVSRRNQFPVLRRAFHASNAFSSFTPRDALSSTTSTSRASRSSHSAAFSCLATNSASIPRCRAPSTIS